MITSQSPQDIQMQDGCMVILEVMADGTKPLQFQWYYEDNIVDGMLSQIVYMPITSCLIGENKSFYGIFPVTIRNTGHYYCQIKNQYGEVNSTIVTLTVTKMPRALHSSKHSRFSSTPSTDLGS